jgi:DNA-binding IscR family transcriptional regulator
MAQSGRFSLSLRVLAYLATVPKAMHTSSEIAEELSESAVMIRRCFLLLEEGGMIEQRKGPNGGARLKTAAKEIGIGDVYLAAEGDWFVFENPSISKLLERARRDSVLAMNGTTLAKVLRRMAKKPLSGMETQLGKANVPGKGSLTRRNKQLRGKSVSLRIGY